MTHYKAMMDTEFVGSWDLLGKDVTVTIAKVEAGRVKSRDNPKGDKKPIVWFEGKDKPFACNSTNCKTIAGMYGVHVEKWVGKRVTLFGTTCQGKGGDQVDCIRIRANIPTDKPGKAATSVAERESGNACPECDGTTSPDCAMCFGTGKVAQ